MTSAPAQGSHNGVGQRLFGLLGVWHFSRVISGSSAATVNGQATLSLTEPDLMRYDEKGTVLLDDGQSLIATQSYVYQPTRDSLIVHFAGEPRRLFHEVLLQDHTDCLRAKGYHLCDQDTYATDYVFDAAMHTFQISHQVTGPHKNYKSETTYTRSA